MLASVCSTSDTLLVRVAETISQVMTGRERGARGRRACAGGHGPSRPPPAGGGAARGRRRPRRARTRARAASPAAPPAPPPAACAPGRPTARPRPGRSPPAAPAGSLRAHMHPPWQCSCKPLIAIRQWSSLARLDLQTQQQLRADTQLISTAPQLIAKKNLGGRLRYRSTFKSKTVAPATAALVQRNTTMHGAQQRHALGWEELVGQSGCGRTGRRPHAHSVDPGWQSRGCAHSVSPAGTAPHSPSLPGAANLRARSPALSCSSEGDAASRINGETYRCKRHTACQKTAHCMHRSCQPGARVTATAEAQAQQHAWRAC